MSVKTEWLNNAIENIKNCQHYAVKDLAKTMDFTISSSNEVNESEFKILNLGRVAELIKNKGLNDYKTTSSRISELRKAKGL